MIRGKLARFYLDLFNSTGILKDKEGQPFPDLDAAVEHARQSIRQIVAQDIVEGRAVDLSHSIAIHQASKEPEANVRFADVIQIVG